MRSSLRLLLIAFLLWLNFAHAEQPAATYNHGSLSVSIPYHATHKGPGRLTMEILDPEEHVLGRTEAAVEAADGDGVWRQRITAPHAIAYEDMIWLRLRYRFRYDDGQPAAVEQGAALEGVEAISRILRRPVVHVLGQTQYLAGSSASVRVIVSDANANEIPETGSVRIELVGTDARADTRLLFSGRLYPRGTVEAHFELPPGLAGSYVMRYTADTPVGSAEFSQPVEIADKASVLLTTEKPIYQPGQTIHIRALTLSRSDHKADAGRPLTFEVEDSRGNKVFKRAAVTDKFGVASAEFSLADEVNLGTYHLRALMGDASAPSSTAEVALHVERYVLPKFKVSVEFTGQGGKPKRDYRPGDHVTGTVHANYFFGQPVAHAKVAIKASGMDVAVFEAASASGETDGEGAYRFDLPLPDYFAGRPLTQGAARALVEASVTDSAEHAETRGEPITISQSSLLLTAVPEGGTLIPGLDNQVYLLSSYPDGTPASTAITVHLSGRDQHVSTDSAGVAVIHLKAGAAAQSLRVDADDRHGNRSSATLPLESRDEGDQILLRTNRAIYKAGDPIELKVFSTLPSGSAYVDVVKDGQTILTRDLELQNGQAELRLAATPEMAGALDLDAYLFGRDAQPVSDHRLVFVQPADELHITAATDAAVYKPGGEARVSFHVTNAHGEGVSAALGLQVVDEAVFALAEKQPGFAKVFFYLEQEVMKPRYEIHSFSLADVVSPNDRHDQQDEQDTEARALFSATEMVQNTRLETEFGRSLPQEKFAEYEERYQAAFVSQVRCIAAKLSQTAAPHASEAEFTRVFKQVTLNGGAHMLDAWHTPLRIEPVRWSAGRNNKFYQVRSAGPDGVFGNDDDLTVYLEQTSGSVSGQAGLGGSLELRVEHDRGPLNDRAEVTGTVVDLSGAVIPDATVTLRQAVNLRTAHASQSGSFTFAALPAGSYQIAVAAQGFNMISRELTVRSRDRAVLAVTLAVGSVSQTVTVQAMPVQATSRLFQTHGRGEGFVAGAAAGVMAGAGLGIMRSAPAQRIAGRSFAVFDSVAPLRKTAAPDAPHVRSYFPEALYINPEIVTDAHGDASISIPIADSITTWRMAMLASTQAGALGTGSASLKVFQDFFADLDLPVTLTQGDRVSIPVAVYNYSGSSGQASLSLKPEDWYSLDRDTPEKTVAVESGQSGGAHFTLTANRIGKFKLTLSARLDASGRREDVVVREIEVVPNGNEQNLVRNGRLETTAVNDLHFPAGSIPDATSILVRLYPGPLSQVIEGMDSILRMPGGCFEQTSSSTYPNVLALDYMKRTRKLTPEVHAKAEGYIANGYQRLLTFEVPGGGFSWFGHAPANKILTAYGLMEFHDMAQVSDVDPKLIERTSEWLVSQQQPDGSWKPDTEFINEGVTNRYNSNVLRITAYIAWSLANTGYQGPAIQSAKRYIETHLGEKPDTYTLAVIANFAADYGAHNDKDQEFTRRAMEAMLDARSEKGEFVSWNAEETGVYSTGASAAIETTGLATQALLKWGQASGTVRKALSYLASTKQAAGNWGTTQATIMALRAILLGSESSASDVRGKVAVLLNGEQVKSLELTAENNDLLHEYVFHGVDALRPASVELRFEGTGGLAYQVVGRYFTPWEKKPVEEPLSIEVAYDRTTLAQNDTATATATIRNNTAKTANMVMVDLGIPPGFELLSEDLQAFEEKTAGAQGGGLEKFSQMATQAILYFNALLPGQTVKLSFRLRAKYPVRARTFESRVYEYYDPAVHASAAPVRLEVREP